MEKQIAFSSKIDVQRYNCFHFELVALDKENDNVEIAVDYGPSHDKPGMIIADVWAGIADDMLRRFLYTEHIPQNEIDMDDYDGYVGIAQKIYHSQVFLSKLKEFLDWAYQNRRC